MVDKVGCIVVTTSSTVVATDGDFDTGGSLVTTGNTVLVSTGGGLYSVVTTCGLVVTIGCFLGTNGGLVVTTLVTTGSLVATTGGLVATTGGLVATNGGLVVTTGGLVASTGGLVVTTGALLVTAIVLVVITGDWLVYVDEDIIAGAVEGDTVAGLKVDSATDD